MTTYLNTANLDDNQIQENFDVAFRESADRSGDLCVSEIDVTVERSPEREAIVKVTIYGLSEVTTLEQFFDSATKRVINGGETIEFEIEGRGRVKFKFDSINRKNSNDYVVTYRPL